MDTKKAVVIFLSILVLVCFVSCNGDGGDGDADAVDIPVEEIDTAEDVGPEDIPGDLQVDEVDVVPDPVEEDVLEEEATDVVPEDVEEEEVIEVTCPIATAGTASLGGILTRGTNMIMDTADTDIDGIGDIVVAIFDTNPISTPSPTPVASTNVAVADLSSETNWVEFCVQDIPAGDLWFGALMDDDDSGVTTAAQFGDIVTMPPPPLTLAADETVTDAHYVMNVRVGRVTGSVTIDPDLAASLSDLTGNLYMGVVDNPTLSPTLLGYSMTEAVTLSPDAAQPFEVLLMLEPTVSNTGYVTAILDVDESGVTGSPEPGDLVNFDLEAVPPVLPPSFDYTITGIDETSDTTIIWVFSL